MTQHVVTAPDGSQHIIDAPDTATPDQIVSFAQQAIPEAQKAQGNDAGAGNAFVNGVNAAVPFGNTVTNAIGAGIGAAAGAGNYSDLYGQAQKDTAATAAAHPAADLAGTAMGIAGTLPIGVEKAITGAIPTTGARGLVNQIPAASAAVGNWVRGGQVAQDAGLAAKAGSAALQSGKSAIVAAPAGALYGAGSAEPGQRTEGAIRGAGVASAVGAGLPLIAPAAGALASTIAPKIDAGTAALAQRAKNFGIDLRLDQLSPTAARKTVQKVSQEIPFSGVDAHNALQAQQFNSAVAKTIGQDATDLGPATINKFIDDAETKFKSAIGTGDFQVNKDDLDAITKIEDNLPKNITKDVADIVREHTGQFKNDLTVSKSSVASGVDDFGRPVTKTVDLPPIISASKLSSLRSDIIKSLPNIDGAARPHVAEIVDIIDGIAERNLPAESIAKLQQARYEWRNFKTIEPLLEKSVDGNINPTQLMNRVAASPYIKASRSAVGEDDLVDLARIGKQFLPKLGGSDTMQKSALAVGAKRIGDVGIAALLGLPKAAAVVGANRAYQSGINSNSALVNLALKNSGKVMRSLPPNTTPLSALAAGQAASLSNRP